MNRDVVVVGAGLAGLTAGVRLAQAGLRTTVVAKGPGATHLAPPTIDVLGYAPDLVERPTAALDSFVAERPDHPAHRHREHQRHQDEEHHEEERDDRDPPANG